MNRLITAAVRSWPIHATFCTPQSAHSQYERDALDENLLVCYETITGHVAKTLCDRIFPATRWRQIFTIEFITSIKKSIQKAARS